MTQIRLLQIAYNGALERWSKEYEAYNRNPGELNSRRERVAWEELEEISRMLKEKEGEQ